MTQSFASATNAHRSGFVVRTDLRAGNVCSDSCYLVEPSFREQCKRNCNYGTAYCTNQCANIWNGQTTDEYWACWRDCVHNSKG